MIEVLERERLPEHAGRMGALLRDGLAEQLAGVPGVVEVRGRGLMVGVELDRPCGELVGRALSRDVLINVTAGNRVRLLPPLIVGEAEIVRIVEVVAREVVDFLSDAEDRLVAT